MTHASERADCTRRCWKIAIVAGIVIATLLMSLGGWGFWASLVIGLVALVAVGIVLPRLICPAARASAAVSRPTPAAAPTASPSPVPAPAAEPAPEPAPEPVAAEHEAETETQTEDGIVKASAALPGQQELAARKGNWRYQPASADEAEPEAAQTADASEPDDLKRISGVGPALERKLNDAGVTRFAQIAAWSDDDVELMDDLLSFRGRITRDNWIEQAKILAAGGETDFSERQG